MNPTRTLIIAAALALGLATSAHAQRSGTRGSNPGRPSDARAGNTGSGDARAGRDGERSDGATGRSGQTARGDRRTQPGRRGPIGVLPFGWWPYVDFDSVVDVASDGVPAPATPAAPPPPPTPAQPSLIQPALTVAPPAAPVPSAHGKLQLDVTPATAHVIVDGFYVGTVEDLARLGGLDVAAGWHRVEFRAPGFVTPAINITVEANRTFSYHGELQPLSR